MNWRAGSLGNNFTVATSHGLGTVTAEQTNSNRTIAIIQTRHTAMLTGNSLNVAPKWNNSITKKSVLKKFFYLKKKKLYECDKSNEKQKKIYNNTRSKKSRKKISTRRKKKYKKKKKKTS